MVRSCDEKRGRKLQEKNYDNYSRGQWTPQLRTTEEAMGRHDRPITRHEDSPIEKRTQLALEFCPIHSPNGHLQITRHGHLRICVCPKVARIAEHKLGHS